MTNHERNGSPVAPPDAVAGPLPYPGFGAGSQEAAAYRGWRRAAFRARDARTQATVVPDGTTVTALVAGVATAVQGAAAVPIGDDATHEWNLGLGRLAAPSLTTLARTAHALDALLARHLLACELAGSLPHDPVTTVAAAGVSGVRARRLLAAARLAQDLERVIPQLWTDWAAGALATDHLVAMADACAGKTRCACRDAVAAVLPGVGELTPAQVRRAVTAALALADPESAQQTEHDEYDARRFTITPTDNGIRVSGVLPTLEGAALAALIDATAAQQRAAGDGLSMQQRRADALATIVAAAADTERPSQGGLPAAVTLTIPVDEAERVTTRTPRTPGTCHSGVPMPGSVNGRSLLGDGAARFGMCCADITPIAVAEPGSLAARLAGTRIQPLAVGRDQRLATTSQRKALELRDGGCVIDGCDISPARCQPHHVHGWALGGASDLKNFALLCWAHHRQVDLDRWDLEWVQGRWRTTPTPRWRWRTTPRHQHAA